MSDLTEKLTTAKDIERHNGMITFTKAFARYLLSFGDNATVGVVLEDWQKALGYFHPSLGSMSAAEITSIILLLGYYLDHAETQVAAVH